MRQEVLSFERLLSVLLCFLVLSVASNVAVSDDASKVTDSNWTFTYLKASDGNRQSLREFVEKNWFEMDRIAVEQGIFKSYRLIENITESAEPIDLQWDFIVAVEYFENQTYTDIREQFEEIRSDHKTVLIDGKGFRELGAVVRSERVVVH